MREWLEIIMHILIPALGAAVTAIGPHGTSAGKNYFGLTYSGLMYWIEK